MKAAAFSLLIVLGHVVAASADTIAMPDGSPVSRRISVDIDNRARSAWVLVAGLQPKALPNSRAAAADGDPFRFMQATFVVSEYVNPDENREYVLLGKSDESETLVLQHFGWVEKRLTICNRVDKPQLNRQAMRLENTISKKAMLVSPVVVVDAGSPGPDDAPSAAPIGETEKNEAGNVSFYDRPQDDERFATGSKRKYFDIFFVFAEVDGFALLGTAESFSEGNPTKVICGWYPAGRDRLCRWNTREAYYWDHVTAAARLQHGMAPGTIATTKDDAYLLTAGKTGGKTIFIENLAPDGSLNYPDPGDPRYPIVEWVSNPGDAKRIHPQTGNMMNRVGWIGQSGAGITNRQRREINRNLKRIADRLNMIDILFVIDDTSSMQPWFARAAAVVTAIRDQARKAEFGDRTRIAISYYNDAALGDRKHSPLRQQLVEINSPEASKQIVELQNHGETLQVAADPLELVYDGIAGAIRRAEFDNDALKLVVVLGHTAGKDSAAEPDVLSRLMHKLSRPIDVFALQVGDTSDQKNLDVQNFQVQMESLIRKHCQNIPATPQKPALTAGEIDDVVNASFIETTDPKQVTDAVLGKFFRLQQQNTADQQTIDELRRGNWATKPGPALAKLLQDAGVNLQELDESGKKQQHYFQEGFAWEFADKDGPDGNPVPQLRLWAFLNGKEIKLIYDIVDRLTKENINATLSELMREQIRILAGDHDDAALNTMRLGDVLEKMHGLKTRSKLFTIPPGKISPNDNLTRDAIEELHLIRNRLQDIVEGKKSTWSRKTTTLENGRTIVQYLRRDIEDFDRVYEGDGSDSAAQWYWIDVELELP